MNDDDMTILSDPARWPFCEARARAAAAEVAYPDPGKVRTRDLRRMRDQRDQVAERQAKRRAERLEREDGAA